MNKLIALRFANPITSFTICCKNTVLVDPQDISYFKIEIFCHMATPMYHYEAKG